MFEAAVYIFCLQAGPSFGFEFFGPQCACIGLRDHNNVHYRLLTCFFALFPQRSKLQRGSANQARPF